jgi:hypothetical protein
MSGRDAFEPFRNIPADARAGYSIFVYDLPLISETHFEWQSRNYGSGTNGAAACRSARG